MSSIWYGKECKKSEDIIKEEVENKKEEKDNSLRIVKLDTRDEPGAQDKYV